MKKIKILLDPEQPLIGDYRSLASAFGMDQNFIKYLGRQSNRTEILLDYCNPTLDELRSHLLREEVDRPDAVEVIEKWIKDNCDCKNCKSDSPR